MPAIAHQYLTEHGMVTIYDLEPQPAAGPATVEPIFLGDSAAMQQARHDLRCAAQTDLPVLLVGDPGTGKGVGGCSGGSTCAPGFGCQAGACRKLCRGAGDCGGKACFHKLK